MHNGKLKATMPERSVMAWYCEGSPADIEVIMGRHTCWYPTNKENGLKIITYTGKKQK